MGIHFVLLAFFSVACIACFFWMVIRIAIMVNEWKAVEYRVKHALHASVAALLVVISYTSATLTYNNSPLDNNQVSMLAKIKKEGKCLDEIKKAAEDGKIITREYDEILERYIYVVQLEIINGKSE